MSQVLTLEVSLQAQKWAHPAQKNRLLLQYFLTPEIGQIWWRKQEKLPIVHALLLVSRGPEHLGCLVSLVRMS